MAKIISQETFDDVVKENIVEFSMSATEAKEETIQQFEAQGINLANIIKDLNINEETGRPILSETIDLLKAHTSGEKKMENEQILQHLDILQYECNTSIPHRVLAAKSDAQKILLTILEKEVKADLQNKKIVHSCLMCFNALINKQPDLFDGESLVLAITILNKEESDFETTGLTLRWLCKACFMHENNRQNIMNANIMDQLKPLVGVKNENIIRDVCSLFRYLILDDDIRVEFGKAHEHARIIASHVLIDLTKLIPEYEDANLISDLILTIASLAVRQEFCASVEEANGLDYVFEALVKYLEHAKLNKEGLKLLKALAGNDTTKVNIVQKGAAPIIQNILLTHKTSEQVASTALACISTLTLRVKDNSTAFFESGVAETIAEAMSLHPKSKAVQRNAAWAIRNMVSRSREQCEAFLSFGVEDLLNEAIKEHPSILQDAKAALRDLGCKVDLKEEWTGKAEKVITKTM